MREFISYVHIKDGYLTPDPEKEGKMKTIFTFAGEGDGKVREIVTDLLKNGYDGGFSIEPHVATVFHDKESDTSLEEVQYTSYVEYGKRFEQLLRDCGWKF